ncbi:hypothetical protein L208DRAFT_1369146 [Tricholoma matsutake]|nr:hypothetical protein L208DRAFT_1369146 [Tricholoma matsutake 945]
MDWSFALNALEGRRFVCLQFGTGLWQHRSSACSQAILHCSEYYNTAVELLERRGSNYSSRPRFPLCEMYVAMSSK